MRAFDAWDESLLGSARFACREGCGLCCFARPSVDGDERSSLLRLDPNLVLEPEEGTGGWALPERGPGGACILLSDFRCRLHAARPFPCRSFPIHPYLGRRVQLSAVLSCPGVDLSEERLTRPGTGPVGLTSELAAVRARAADASRRSWMAQVAATVDRLYRRAARRPGFVVDEQLRREGALAEEVARQATPALADEPPGTEDLDLLPIYWDEARGVTAIAAGPGGYDLLPIRAGGGAGARRGQYPRPTEPPRLTADGARLLAAYLGYVLRRDAFLDAEVLDWSRSPDPPDLEAWVSGSLRRVASTVMVRAVVRSLADGAEGVRLDGPSMDRGIRATDADVLDRPLAGALL